MAATEKTKKAFIQTSQGICTKQNRFREAIGFGLLWTAAIVVLLILGITLWYIFSRGAKQAFSFSYLFTAPQGGRNDQGGILYPLIGTLYLIGGSILVAAPLGVFAAVYLNEYADPVAKFTKWARFAIESLAGIPSVIYGLFGLAFFASFLGFRQSMLSASLSVAIMILPVIIRTAEEAIEAVPRAYRDASYALGANKVQTIFQVVLPSAVPGIFTGIMLSIGRAIAESAILILAAGGSITSLPRLVSESYPYILPDSGRTLAVHLFFQANSYDSPDRVFGTAVILILLILLLNLLAYFGLSFGKLFKTK